MTQQTELHVALDDLYLDPNNFRFQDDPKFQAAQEHRYHEDSVQRRTLERIKQEGLSDLKASIQHNGFLTYERIIVRPYGHIDGKYIVVEGNRRVAALKSLQQDHAAGIEVREDVLTLAVALPVVCVDAEGDDSVYLSVMGIRHVSGIRQWGSYQSSNLVAQLRDQHDVEFAEIGSRLGMSTREVTRRYRAFKALRQFEEDEEFGDNAERRMYPMFHEAVSQPIIRTWLGWTEATSTFTNEEALHQFYELISPREIEEGVEQPPKITTSGEVRELRAIISSPEAKAVLLDPSKSFAEALAIAKADELHQSWATQIAEATRALNGISALELPNLTQDHIKMLTDLRAATNQLLETHARLTSV